jgi:hypothetical protein
MYNKHNVCHMHNAMQQWLMRLLATTLLRQPW